jgi:hypothetical protein
LYHYTKEGPVVVMFITRAGFEEVLGPLQNIINADRKFRERNAAQREITARRPSWGSGEVVSPMQAGGGGDDDSTYPSVLSPLRLGRMSNGECRRSSPGEGNTPRDSLSFTAAGGEDGGRGEGGGGMPPRGVSPASSINFTSPRVSGNAAAPRGGELYRLNPV